LAALKEGNVLEIGPAVFGNWVTGYSMQTTVEHWSVRSTYFYRSRGGGLILVRILIAIALVDPAVLEHNTF